MSANVSNTTTLVTCKSSKSGKTFLAGSIKNCIDQWKLLTSDPTILTAVSGYKIDLFIRPSQFRIPRPLKCSALEANNIDRQITIFLEKGIIVASSHEPDEFISTVFLGEKKDGTFRMILNLKDFNKWVNYNHFKMDSIQTCVQLMKPYCYLGSIDLKDAYFSIPIHKDHQKYLKFCWKNTLYQFTCLPQGLACAPRLFTKLMKPVFASLRERGHLSSGYLDDSLLVGYSYAECKSNIVDTTNLLTNLGLYPHEDKSVTIPTQIIQHLGFVLNSIDMTVSLTEEKISTLTQIAQLVVSKSEMPIRLVAKLIGHMVSCFPGVEFGELFYRQLEIEKSASLKSKKGNFDANMSLSEKARSDIQWWISNAHLSKKVINHGGIDFTMSTDASLLGWGASLENTTAGGRWSNVEREHHINYLELKAVLLGLQSLCNRVSKCHIKVLTDNTTAVAYLRNMGGTRSILCNDMAREIWLWCKEKQIWLSVSHIPGADNVACEQSIDPFCLSVNKVLDFLSGLYNQGLGYSGSNTARCALSSLVTLENMGNMTIGQHPLVQRLVKGVFHERPSLPRYHNTWDTYKVSQFLKTFASLTEIKLRELTYKLIMLCALVTGQRCQSLHLMNLDTMIKSASSYRFVIHNLVKQSAPGKAQPVLVLPKFDEDERLCVYSVLEEYVQRTNSIRNNESQLFISFAKPHKKVSKDTIARWTKHVMSLSGIDTSVFKPHSTRAASTSKASKCSVPISHIMSAASWASDSTFHKFYKREVGQLQDSAHTFGQAILLDATN